MICPFCKQKLGVRIISNLYSYYICENYDCMICSFCDRVKCKCSFPLRRTRCAVDKNENGCIEYIRLEFFKPKIGYIISQNNNTTTISINNSCFIDFNYFSTDFNYLKKLYKKAIKLKYFL